MKLTSSLRAFATTIALALAATTGLQAQLLFTQYYEGTSFNKWIEIKNVGTTAVDLTNYSLSLYTNANAEAWKSGTTISSNFALSGSLAANGVYLLGNTQGVLPTGVTANVNNNTVINFNGNDSLVLWNDAAAYSTARIVDALSFTNLGNEGIDVSFLRTSLDVGYNLTSGTDILNFGSVWQSVSLATVNSAVAGADAYLGSSTLAAASAIPEPSTYAAIFGALALAGVVIHRRRRQSLAA